MGAPRKIARLLAAFGKAQTGVAAVEFAMILPIMLVLYIGMVEGSMLISMDRKVQTVSGAVGDLVARVDGNISGSTINDYVKISGGIMTPYDDTNLAQTISQVYVASDGRATVDWSRHYVGQVLQSSGAHSAGEQIALPNEFVAISRGQYVIVSEAAASYSPLFGLVFESAVNLNRENFYLPRFRERIILN